MRYVDPDGEVIWVPVIIGAVLGGTSGWQIGKAKGAEGWAMFGYILGGAAIGGLSSAAGSAVTTSLGATISSQFGGLIATGIGGATAGAISGFGFNALAGGNPIDGFWKGAVSGLAGGALGGYISGGAGAFVGGSTSSLINTALNGGDAKDILKSAAIGGVVAWGAYQTQQAINFKAHGQGFSRKQFNTMTRATQKSFTRGKEYGGWLLANGSIEMWQPGHRSGITPTARPSNAVGFFHTHPNAGPNWIEPHSGADIAFNNSVARVNSYVIGRSNFYLQVPHGQSTLLSGNHYFNPYIFNPFYNSIR